ncbi:MAG TPA: PilZ domain-containing protein [Kofleriaceae bacterium]|nr:PilZ domain-containing protein [Kofleriaceae bacterium]
MESSSSPPYEVYLVVDNARSQALTRAWDRFDDAAVAAVDLYFRANTDVALVAVHLRNSRDRGRWIGHVVASGVAVIDPARMGDGDRRAFFATYLQSYEVVARGCKGLAGAMTALRSRAAKPNARGTGPSPAIRDEAPDPPSERPRLGSEPEPPALPPIPVAGRGAAGRATTLGMGAIKRPGTGPGEESASTRAPTVEYRGRDTEPLMPPALVDEHHGHTVKVRFLRGGTWSHARLRSLSARGAYLVTGAPPRMNDEVHVALQLGDLSAVVRGTVYHVTTARDAVETGSSGFAVRFPVEAGPMRDRLIELLHRARAEGVVIKPPPSRTSVRFPVRWPVELRGLDGTCGDALDVSLNGLFISPQVPLRAETVTAVVPIDVGDPPIELTARVARAITTADASVRGLTAGYGLEIIEMSEGDRVRWTRFLARVERRAARTVLVGAAPRRLEAIARALTDAGYAVTSSADAGALVRLADGPQLPDVAVIDDSLLEQGVSAAWLEQMFTQRQVPCITVRGDATRARLVVDRLLAVAAT